MPKYFHELTIKEMFEHHDHTYMMADDNRYYENGRKESETIENKVKSIGGWTKELVDLWNKYAPGSENDDRFKKDWEWIKKHQR